MSYEPLPMSSRHVALTYHDYAALPDDGRRYEIHDGELSVTAAPSPQHQLTSANLFRILDAHVRSHGLGVVLYAPLDVILSDSAIVQPDLVYLASERLNAVSGRGIEGPPTLAVEILSPSTATTDRATKASLYASHGVPFFWLVDPGTRAIEAYRLAGDRYAVALRATGTDPVDLPPFTGLALIPASLWP
jgi:Uma2 family endonuclease